MSDRVVLCFGDSNTWGASPQDISRFPFKTRWPGQLVTHLGHGWRVVEEGLPNRTTCFHDPAITMRSGEEVLPMLLETHSPIHTVVIMLGTNDPKSRVQGVVKEAVDALRRMAELCRNSGPRPLIVAPAPMEVPIKYDEFEPAVATTYCRELNKDLSTMSKEHGIPFLDAGTVVRVSSEDGVHLDESAHEALARAIGAIILGEQVTC